jgi:hypothetical protein
MKNEDKVAADVLHYAEVLQVNKKYEQSPLGKP